MAADGLAGAVAGPVGQALAPVGVQPARVPVGQAQPVQEVQLGQGLVDGRGRVGRRRLAEPAVQRHAPSGVRYQQRIQLGFHRRREQRGQAPVRNRVGLQQGLAHQQFQHRDGRPQQAVLVQLLAGRLQE